MTRIAVLCSPLVMSGLGGNIRSKPWFRQRSLRSEDFMNRRGVDGVVSRWDVLRFCL